MPPKKDYIPKEQFWYERKLYRVLRNDTENISLISKVSKLTIFNFESLQKPYIHIYFVVLL